MSIDKKIQVHNLHSRYLQFFEYYKLYVSASLNAVQINTTFATEVSETSTKRSALRVDLLRVPTDQKLIYRWNNIDSEQTFT